MITKLQLTILCGHKGYNNYNPIITVSIMLLLLMPAIKIQAQFKSTHFKKVEASDYVPQLEIYSDSMFAPCTDGVYCMDLKTMSKWKLWGFANEEVIDFKRFGNKAIAIVVRNNQVRLLSSEDNGKNFIDSTPDFTDFCPGFITQHPIDKNKLIIMARNIYGSSDFGSHWQFLSYGGFNNSHSFLSYHPLSPEVVFFSSENLIFQGFINKSVDGGYTWLFNDPYGHGDNCIHQIAFHPSDKNILLFSGEGIVGKSTDCGNNWTSCAQRDDYGYVYNIMFDSENTDNCYFVGCVYPKTIALYKSTDIGDTWKYIDSNDTIINSKYIGDSYHDAIIYEGKIYIYTDKDIYYYDTDQISTIDGLYEGNQSYVSYNNGSLCFPSGKAKDVTVYDSAGRMLINKKNISTSLNVSYLTSGIYIATITTETHKMQIIKFAIY